MAKLVSVKYPTAYAGQTLNFPLIGSATFEKDGSLEVADDKVDEFIELTFDSFTFENLDTKEEEEENEEEEGTSEGVPEQKVKVTKATGNKGKAAKEKEKKKMQEHLDSLNFKQLIELAKETDIPQESLAAMTDKKLRKELLTRLV